MGCSSAGKVGPKPVLAFFAGENAAWQRRVVGQEATYDDSELSIYSMKYSIRTYYIYTLYFMIYMYRYTIVYHRYVFTFIYICIYICKYIFIHMYIHF